MNTGYFFERLGGSAADGYNDPLKSIFGKSMESVVRESFQNSIDAVNDSTKPVRIHIVLENFRTDDIPSATQLRRILEACSKIEDATAKRHFEESIKILDSNEIPVLKISDFNTKGLTGEDDEKGGNFYNFFKAVGAHNKGATAGGSYGYGKSTNLAHSAFDLFFAHSSFLKGKSLSNVFMGSMRVCSHEIDGYEMRGIGSFGLAGQRAIRNSEEIPEKFRRTSGELGTDIFIPAYKHTKDWKINTIRAVLKNFWLAILLDKLVVEVDNTSIGGHNIKDRIFEYFPQSENSASGRAGYRKVDSPVPFYLAYTEGQKTTHTLPQLGTVECHVSSVRSDGHTNSFACFRQNLMLIQHKAISSVVPYSGVFLCNDSKGNATLKKMEPPLHDLWSKKERNALDEEGRPTIDCVNAEREFSETLIGEVRKLLSSRATEVIKLDSLNSIISLSGGGETRGAAAKRRGATADQESVSQESDKVRHVKVTLTPSRKFERRFEPGDDTGGGRDKHNSTGKDNDDEIRKPREGDEQRLERSLVRTMLIGRDTRRRMRIIVRTNPPRPNAAIKLQLSAGTDDSFQKVPIDNIFSSDGEPKIGADGSSIENLKSDSTGKISVDVEFQRNQIYSLKTDVYEAE